MDTTLFYICIKSHEGTKRLSPRLLIDAEKGIRNLKAGDKQREHNPNAYSESKMYNKRNRKWKLQ